MRKLNISILAAAAVLFAGCAADAGKLAEAGVSRELAEYRAEHFSGLSYELEFGIPESLDSAISGKGKLTFTSDGRGDLILDFLPGKVEGTVLNGKEVEVEYANGHVIIGRKHLREGENTFEAEFTPADRFLNRNKEYLYSLFVPSHARSVFPCMDQPDMKARFSVKMELPEGWTGISNGTGKQVSTYHFAFAAGKWQTYSETEGGMTMTALHREDDPAKTAQLPEIFREIRLAVAWLEEFTGIPLPFENYNLVIVPGFQFGGMEHPGCIFYNENTMFLQENPTDEDRLRRIKLIAHETSHLWFGDLVTMKWFDDVWTKEVFANYFAAQISEPMFPAVDHRMAWLRTYVSPALSQDRTEGATAIRQALGNLDDAGLVYNDIIYDKSAVVMKNLVDYMGTDGFRDGIREYLKTYSYSNATWEDLVDILDAHSDKDLKEFSRIWVHEKGLPYISITRDGDSLRICDEDPAGLGRRWHQKLKIASDRQGVADTVIELGTEETVHTVPAGYDRFFVPNPDGMTYGFIKLDSLGIHSLLDSIEEIGDASCRASALMVLYENYLREGFDVSYFAGRLLDIIENEKDQQVASMAISCLNVPFLEAEDFASLEERLYKVYLNHPVRSVRTTALRSLARLSTTPEANERMYGIWLRESEKMFSPSDYTALSYQLAVRYPERAAEILATQRGRLDGSDSRRPFNRERLMAFDFISPAVSPDEAVRDSVFSALLKAENRQKEPWTQTALSLLNHRLRDAVSVKYIIPGLRALGEVKATGDIFFPGGWCSCLLGSHRSAEAYGAYRDFMDNENTYSGLLTGKILDNAYMLEREQTRRK